MARELSQKRELRIRQERVRHLSSDPRARPPGVANQTPAPSGDGSTTRTLRDEIESQPSSPPFYPERRASILDDVAVEIDELTRDLRAGFRRWEAPDRITFVASVLTLVGVLLPWTSAGDRFELGITAGGAVHAALAATAIGLLVGRSRLGERVGARVRGARARRTSLWHLLLGALSTALCAYFLVVYGMQRTAASQLEIRFGLYVTLAAGMGLSYGGFARFFSRNHE